MSVRFGINPLTWTNDDLPSLGADTPLDICLQEGKAAGYTGFELGNKFPREAGALSAVLDKHELALVSGWFSGELLSRTTEEEIEAIDSHLQLLKTVGAKVMVYCEVTGCIHGDQQTPISYRPQLSESQWPEFGKRLTAVAEHCLKHGVRLCYHHHMGTVVQTEAEVDALMDHTGDAVALLLDSGHLTFAGGDPVAVQQRYASRIAHVHCKDIREEVLTDVLNRNLSFLDAVLNGVFTVPGDGCVDFQTIFKGLAQSAYQGWLVVEAEQDPIVAPSFKYAQLGCTNLKNLCNASGLVFSNTKPA